VNSIFHISIRDHPIFGFTVTGLARVYCITIIIIIIITMNRRVCSELRSVLQRAVLPSCGGGVCIYLGAVVEASILLSYDC
jgi:hypothetical protein